MPAPSDTSGCLADYEPLKGVPNLTAALHAGLQGGHLSSVKLLLKKGADQSYLRHEHIQEVIDTGRIDLLGALSSKGVGRKDFVEKLCKLCQINMLAEIIDYVSKKSLPEMAENVLFAAAKLGRVDVMDLALEKGCNLKKVALAAVKLIAFNGNVEAFDWLLNQAILPLSNNIPVPKCGNIPPNSTEKDTTCLDADVWKTEAMFAACSASFGSTEGTSRILKKLIEQGVDVRAENDRALLKAAATNNYKCVSILLKHGANARCKDDTALTLAAANGYVESLELLISHGGDVNAKCGRPLLKAVRQGKQQTVDLLVTLGASIQVNNQAALFEAIRAHNVRLLQHIVQLGCSPYGRDGFALVAAALEKDPLLLQAVIDLGVHVEGHNALCAYILAVANNCVSSMKILLSRGVDPSFGCPLTVAVLNNSVDALQFLIANGVNVCFDDHFALKLAAERGKVDVVKLLMHQGDRSSIELGCEEALNRACSCGSHEVVKQLLDHGTRIDQLKGLEGLAFAATCAQYLPGMHMYNPIDCSDFIADMDLILSTTLRNGEDYHVRQVRKLARLGILEHDRLSVSHSNAVKTMQLLLDRTPDASADTIKAKTCLGMICRTGNSDMLRLLLSRGIQFRRSSINLAKDAADAVKRGHLELIKLLVHELGADCFSAADGQARWINIAAQAGHTSIVQWLLDMGAQPDAHDGQTLCIASANGHKDIVRLILKHREKQNATKQNMKQRSARSKRAQARNSGSSNSSVDIDAMNMVALKNAVIASHFPIAKLLLDSGISPTGEHTTDIIIAAITNGMDSIAHRLILPLSTTVDRGVISFTKNTETRGKGQLLVALVFGAMYGHFDVVKAAIQSGGPSLLTIPMNSWLHNPSMKLQAWPMALQTLAKVMHDIASFGEFALLLAAQAAFPDIVNTLLDNSVDPFRTPQILVETATAGRSGILHTLLCSKFGDTFKKTKQCKAHLWTALLSAIGHHDAQTTKTLIDHGAPHHHNAGQAMLIAALSGGAMCVNILIQQGADIHSRRDAALIWACSNKQFDTVSLLLDHGAKVNAWNGEALLAAVRNQDLEIVELLLRKGADPNLQQDEALLLACTKNHPGIITAVRAHRLGRDLHRALTHACMQGCLDNVTLLIEQGADIHTGKDNPLLQACTYGHLEVVKFLIMMGADVHATLFLRPSMLEAASSEGHIDVVQFLLECCKFEVDDISSALEHAAQDGKADCCRILLEAGADVNIDNSSPLFEAAASGSPETVSILLDHGANVAAEDCSAFFRACSKNQAPIVKLMTDRGVDLRKVGEMALLESAQRGHFEVVQVLLEMGAVMSEHVLEVTASGGHLCTMEALLRNQHIQMEWLPEALLHATSENQVEMINLIIQTMSGQGNNEMVKGAVDHALQRAISTDQKEAIEKLLDTNVSFVDINLGWAKEHILLAAFSGSETGIGLVLLKAKEMGIDGPELFVEAIPTAIDSFKSRFKLDCNETWVDSSGVAIDTCEANRVAKSVLKSFKLNSARWRQQIPDFDESICFPKEYWNDCLVRASGNACHKVIQLLLQQGADGNTQEGVCLQNACKIGHTLSVLALLQAGADPNAKCGTAIKIACELGRCAEIDLLLSNGGICTSECFENACASGKTAVLDTLRMHNALNKEWGQVGFIAAAAHSQIAMVQALLDSNMVNLTEAWLPAARAALRNGHSDMETFLRSQAQQVYCQGSLAKVSKLNWECKGMESAELIVPTCSHYVHAHHSDAIQTATSSSTASSLPGCEPTNSNKYSMPLEDMPHLESALF